MSKGALLNYTTSISAEKTVSEIQGQLARAGARQILHEYDAAGNVSALSFKIHTQFGEVAFQLPANIAAVEAILKQQSRAGRVPKRLADYSQATRVGWRILKDWIEAQVALIQTGMVTMEQVMLPFAQNQTGKTVYEALCEKKFSGLALPAPNQEAA